MVAMVRPTTRHYAALSATVEAASIVDTNAPGYGVIGRFPIEHEDGSKTFGVFMQWDNWTTNAYTIQRSKDFINWETVVTSGGDDGRVLVIYDPEDFQFYRISP
jgi:hypothetical protein